MPKEKVNDREPAFPSKMPMFVLPKALREKYPDLWEELRTVEMNHAGMSLRDYFAGRALTGLVVVDGVPMSARCTIASRAYELADAMLEARKK